MPAFHTQILAGSRNLTLRTLSDLAGAIGYRLLPEAMPLAKPYSAYLAGRVPGCLWSERGDLAMDYEGVVDAFDSLDGSLRLAACNDAKTESDVTADQVPDSVALAA